MYIGIKPLISPVIVSVPVTPRLVVGDGLCDGEVEDAYTDPTGEQHGEVGEVGELRPVRVPTQP